MFSMIYSIRRLGVVFCALLVVSCTTEYEGLPEAEVYVSQNRFYEAAIVVKNVIQKSSGDHEARTLLGKIYFNIGDYSSSEIELLKAVEYGASLDEVYPTLAKVFYRSDEGGKLLSLSVVGLSDESKAVVMAAKGLNLLSKGMQEQAKISISKALFLSPDSRYVRIAQVRSLLFEGNYKQAKLNANSILSMERECSECLRALADVEIKQGNYVEAYDALSMAIDYGTGRADDYLSRSFVLMQMEDYEKAQVDVDYLESKFKGDSRVNYAQGLIYYNDGKIDKAKEVFEKVVLAYEDYSPVMFYLAAVNLDLGFFEQAELLANKFVLTVPNSVSGRKLLSYIYFVREKFSLAERSIRPVVDSGSEDVEALNLFANILMKNGASDEAVSILSRVVDLEPDSPVALSRLGAGLLVGGREGEGVQYVESALKVDADYFQADTILILHHLKNNDYENASSAALRYVERDSRNSMPHNLLARTYLSMGREPEAVASFSKARLLSPGDPYSCHSLALLALKSGDVDGAREKYIEVLEHHDNYLPSILGLASLDALENDESAMVDRLSLAIKWYPNEVKPRLILARYHIGKGEFGRASGLIQTLSDDIKSTPPVLRIIALYQLGLNAFSSAQYTLLKLIEIDASDEKVRLLLARAYGGGGYFDKSRAELEKAIEINPRYYNARIALAYLLVKLGDYKQVSLQLDALKKLVPKHPEVEKLKSIVLIGTDDELLVSYENSFENNPSSLTLLLLSRHKWKIGDRDKAIEMQELWVEKNSNDVVVRLSLAKYYRITGKIKKSRSQYIKIVEVDSDNITALNNLAWSLRKSSPSKALDYAQKANDVSHNSAETLDTLAVVLLENGDVDRAKHNISRALLESPEDKVMRYHSAMIDVAAGDNRTAEETLLSLLKGGDDFPEKEEANKLLEKIQSEG